MNLYNNQRIKIYSGYIFLALLFSLVISFSAFKIDDPDTMQYLAIGKRIVHEGFSSDCVYSYAANGCQTAYAEWLPSLLIYAVHVLGGFTALTILQVVLAMVIFGLVVIYNRRASVNNLVTVPLLVLILYVAMERFMLRSELFALVIFLGLYYVLSTIADSLNKLPVKKVYMYGASVLVLQLLWANMHGSFPLGWAMLGAFFLDYILCFLWARWRGGLGAEFILAIKLHALLLAGAVVVSLISPYGFKAFVWPFQFYFGSSDFHSQLEFQSPFIASDFTRLAVTVYEWLMAVTLLVCIFAWRHLRFYQLFILVGLLLLSMNSIRYIALFAVFAGLILPGLVEYSLSKCWVWLEGRFVFIHKLKTWLALGFVLIVLIFILHADKSLISNQFYLGDLRWRRFGFGQSELVYPIGAAHFIVEHGIQGHMFNDYGSGTYINWVLFPSRQSFIDGHTYTLKLLEEYKAVIAGNESVSDLQSKHQINYFLLNYLNGDTLSLAGRLYADPQWKLVYLDETSVVFVQNTAENKVVVDCCVVDFVSFKGFKPDSLSILKEKINISTGYASRAGLFSTFGLEQMAEQQYKKALDINPKDFVTWVNYAKVLSQLNKKEEAKSALNKSISIEPAFAPAHFYLGTMFALAEDWPNAKKEFELTVLINDEYPDGHFNLAISHEALEDYTRAKEEYKKELALHPEHTKAKLGLARLDRK